MYKCPTCNKILTDLDFAFEKHFPVKHQGDCKCIQCMTNGEIANAFQKAEERAEQSKKDAGKSKKASLKAIISLVVAIMVTAPLGIFIDSDPSTYVIFACVVFLWIPCWLAYAICVCSLLSSFDMGLSPGSVFLFLIAHLWVPFYFIIAHCTKNHGYIGDYVGYECRDYPTEIQKAYIDARKEVKRFPISQEVDEFRGMCSKYAKEKNDIIKKYSILGQDRVDEELKKLTFPVKKFKVQNTDYYILNCTPSQTFILYQDEKGDLQGKVVANDFFIKSDGSWQSDFINLGISQESIDMMKKIIYQGA